MTTPLVALPLTAPAAPKLKKKRVLLVDTSAEKRELRSETMRKLGMDVDSAADISEARSWWRAGLYDLVLIDMESEKGHRDKFCEDIRGATPTQQLAFLVGKPGYLADAPNADGLRPVPNDDHPTHWKNVRAALTAEPAADKPESLGIMHAARRISEVRSLTLARSKAIKERPAPVRDLETRSQKSNTAWSRLLPELQKEEVQ